MDRNQALNLLDYLLWNRLSGLSHGHEGDGITSLGEIDLMIADFVKNEPSVYHGALDGWSRAVVC